MDFPRKQFKIRPLVGRILNNRTTIEYNGGMKFLLVFLFVVFTPLFAFAQNPSVASFDASPTSINSGQPVSFLWTLQNAGGYSFLIPCIAGIKIKSQSGSPISCDTRISSTIVVSDSLSLFLTNISGGTRSVTARVIPKTSGGQDYDTASRDVHVSVGTHPQPITSFTTSASTTAPGTGVTLSWASQDLDGVNFSFECKEGISISSPSYTQGAFLPCGTPAFPGDLGSSGSITFNFTNASVSTLPLKATLLPAFTSRQYDGTHAAYLDLTIASDVLPDPVVTSFSASSTSITSGETVNITWVTDKSKGANLRLSCIDGLTATSSKNPAATLPCDALAFSDGLNAIGTLSLLFRNNAQFKQTAILDLLPSKRAGEYDATRQKSIALTIHPAPPATPAVAPPPVPLSTSTPIVTPSPALASSPSPAPTATSGATPLSSPPLSATFRQNLRRGSTGNEVNALQDFLKKDPLLYPESIVSGSFGSLTEAAVKRFQKKYGLPETGTVGPLTREKLNMLSSAPNTFSPPPSPTATASVASPAFRFTRGIGIRARGEDVRTLQEFLAKDKTLYPEGAATGYFGPATERAVKKFQEKYGLTRPGDQGYGYVGPKTRERLNALLVP